MRRGALVRKICCLRLGEGRSAGGVTASDPCAGISRRGRAPTARLPAIQAADLTRDMAHGQPEFDARLAAIHGVLGSAAIEPGRPIDAYRPPLLQPREFLEAH